MKLYRTMSFEEFEKFMNGENLVAYNSPNDKTSATAPCFYFAERIYDMQRFLFHGEDDSIVCEFQVDKSKFEEGYGTIDVSLNFGEQTYSLNIPEYYISSYNNKTIKLTDCFYLQFEEYFSEKYPEKAIWGLSKEKLAYFMEDIINYKISSLSSEYNDYKKNNDSSQMDRCLRYINALNFVKTFEQINLYDQVKKINCAIRDELEEEADLYENMNRDDDYYDYDYGDYDYEDENENESETDEIISVSDIADAIDDLRKGELAYVLDETIKRTEMNGLEKDNLKTKE